MQSKEVLRKEYLFKRKNSIGDMQDYVLGLDHYLEAKIVCSYISTQNEAPTSRIIDHAFKNKTLAVPRFH